MQHACWNWTDLAAATGGTWAVSPECSRADGVAGVVDDSRQIVEGVLFIAIQGEMADGHDYILPAVRGGAAAICFDRPLHKDVMAHLRRHAIPSLRVRDSLTALQSLAQVHRQRFPNVLMVAITGSCGKTSTKEMIAALLQAAYPAAVLKTEGNTNNHFGVPRNLLRLTAAHKAAVIELGSNHPGEIATLAALVQADIGVVSNIGPAHLEFFGDLAGVAMEKGSLLDHTAWSGVAIYHGDAPHAATLARCAGARRTLTFGQAADNDIRVDYLGRRNDAWTVRLTWTRSRETRDLRWHIGGAHQALNAGAAAAVGTAAGMDPGTVTAALAAARLPRMRMEILRDRRGTVWVNDAYNANPASMRAGILSFLEQAAGVSPDACVIILGDMLELGGAALAEHEHLLEWVRARAPRATVVGIGPIWSALAGQRRLTAFASTADAAPAVADDVRTAEWVFLKGSRGIGLEVLVPADAVTADSA